MGDTPWGERGTIVLEISKTVRGNPAISCMLAIDVVIAAILIYFKFKAHPANVEYMHLLVTYHFGFMKRALVGTVVSFFAQKVPIYFVYAIGLTVWLLTLILYVALFFRSLGCHKDRALLFAFIIGSPFFFKNFLFSVGYFDIYGCAFAILALLVPANAAYPLIMTVGCAILLLIHHLHLFIYIPTIGFIFIVRYYLLSQVTLFRILLGAAAMGLLLAIFMVVLLANAPVPSETLFYYMASRALDPFEAGLLRIWYSNVGEEMRRTWSAMPTFALRIPIYVALIALHIPLIRFFKQIVGFLAVRRDKVIVLLGLAAITAAYAMMWIIVHDHARHLSNWAVFIQLSMHAATMLPTRTASAPTDFDSKVNRLFAWAVTCIPRVGITTPF
jgi:hypothetical protein